MKHYDIIIVGAGAAGVFMAYELTKLGCGADVLVIEKGAPLEERACPIAPPASVVICMSTSEKPRPWS